VLSFPAYAAFYHHWGTVGLALASNLGIVLQTLTIAALLHKRHMVSLASLDFAELGRCLLAGLVAGATVWVMVYGASRAALHLHFVGLHNQRLLDAAMLIVGGALWLAVTKWVLEAAGSALPRVAMKRLHLA
jgi:putative peptidoglycan lipid II flippase